MAIWLDHCGGQFRHAWPRLWSLVRLFGIFRRPFEGVWLEPFCRGWGVLHLRHRE